MTSRLISLLLVASFFKVALPFTVHHQQRLHHRTALIVVSSEKAVEQAPWKDEDHLAHGLSQVHEETNAELLESEMAAAEDAHDSIDAGMEAAAEERAVMIAHELIHEMKARSANNNKDNNNDNSSKKWANDHLSHGIAQVHEETNDELLESEMAAAEDAHDSIDAGMEAAAEERAVMIAHELIHEMREKALKKKNQIK